VSATPDPQDVAYLRRSATRAKLDKIEEQKAHLITHGVRVRHWYQDPGVSGSKRADKHRPDYVAMLAELDAGTAIRIYVVEPSRLTRGYFDAGDLLDRMERNPAIRVIHVPADGPMKEYGHRELHRWLEDAIRESQLAKERRAKVVTQKRANGEWIGGQKPYGYRRTLVVRDGKPAWGWEEDPTEGATVRRGATWLAEGIHASEVARKLNREGVPAPQGGPWAGLIVRRVWRTARFVGMHSVPPKDEKGHYRPERRRALLPSTGDYDFPAILDREVWDEVQDRLDAHSTGRVAAKSNVNLLAGYLRCAECGARLRKVTSNVRGKTYAYWIHPNLEAGASREGGCVGPTSVKAADVEDETLTQVIEHLAFVSSASAVSVDVDAVERELSDARARRSELAATLAKNPALAGTLAEAVSMVEREIAELTAKLTAPASDPRRVRADDLVKFATADVVARRGMLPRWLKVVHVQPIKQGTAPFDPNWITVEFTSPRGDTFVPGGMLLEGLATTPGLEGLPDTLAEALRVTE
jgi:DNA invertase Pin-like site-specific DNA recombinase